MRFVFSLLQLFVVLNLAQAQTIDLSPNAFQPSNGNGTSGQVLQTNGLGQYSWQNASSGGTPGGSSGQMQYNNAGVFGGTAFTTDGNNLSMGNGHIIQFGTTGSGVQNLHTWQNFVAGNVLVQIPNGNAFELTSGQMQLDGAASAGAGIYLQAPTGSGAVTQYTLTLPGTQPTSGNTFLSCTAANPAVCSWTTAASNPGTGGTLSFGTDGSISGNNGGALIATPGSNGGFDISNGSGPGSGNGHIQFFNTALNNGSPGAIIGSPLLLESGGGNLKLQGDQANIVEVTANTSHVGSIQFDAQAGSNAASISNGNSANTGGLLVTSGTLQLGGNLLFPSGTPSMQTPSNFIWYFTSGNEIRRNVNGAGTLKFEPGGVTTAGTIEFTLGSNLQLDGATFGSVSVVSPAAPTTWTMTLPTTSGTNGQVLTTDGTGITSWTTPSGGGITNPLANNTPLQWRNAGNTANISVVNLNASNNAVIGDPASPAVFIGSDSTTANAFMRVQPGGHHIDIASQGVGALGSIFLSAPEVMLLNSNDGSGTVATQLEYFDASQTWWVGLKAPDSGMTAAVTFTLPGTDGTAGQFIKTDGSGHLSFANPSSLASHVVISGTAPTINTCGGGSPSVVGNDSVGRITVGTITTSCSINFASSYTHNPICIVDDESTAGVTLQPSTTTAVLTITGSVALSGNSLVYHCFDYQ